MNQTLVDPIVTVAIVAVLMYLLFLVIRAGVSAAIKRTLDPRLLQREVAPTADEPPN